MTRRGLQILPVEGLGEVATGAILGELIAARIEVENGDVLVVTQKIVSKAEGQIVSFDESDPGAKRRLVQSESRRVLRERGELLITETRHGFICANAGVDLSNVTAGSAALLPVNPDRSARKIRDYFAGKVGRQVGVIISDTFGRVWRRGVTDIAIGCAGIAAVLDLRGSNDALGRELVATEICLVDEIAGAAELVMGKASGIPVAVVRGLDPSLLRESSVADEVIRSPEQDLFR
jgi:coenzyme F420-0:L-glutamate ligase/coenzyme F420-1:gamma-L-glutamate ligase